MGGEALFEPGIGFIGVAADFPEAEDVAVDEGDFADELGAFPGVFLRHYHARGSAVFHGDGFAVDFVGDEDVVIHADFERVVGGVAVVAFEKDKLCFRLGFDEVGNGEEGDTFPFHLEFAPGGDTVKIADVLKLREGGELIPVECNGILDKAVDLELPFIERDFRMDAEIEHGPILNELLAGWEAILGAEGGLLLASHFSSPAFFARDEIFVHGKRITPHGVKAMRR